MHPLQKLGSLIFSSGISYFFKFAFNDSAEKGFSSEPISSRLC